MINEKKLIPVETILSSLEDSWVKWSFKLATNSAHWLWSRLWEKQEIGDETEFVVQEILDVSRNVQLYLSVEMNKFIGLVTVRKKRH